MTIKRSNVREVLCYSYAQLIADSAIERRSSLAPHPRQSKVYWWFVAKAFRKLVSGEMSPSSVLRENKMLMASRAECGYCGAEGTLQWEHLFPKSRGGPDTIDNLVLSCPRCNQQKGAMNPIEWYDKRGLSWRHIPRLVMGKCLKLVWEEHERQGTLLNIVPPDGKGLNHAEVFKVFENRPQRHG